MTYSVTNTPSYEYYTYDSTTNSLDYVLVWNDSLPCTKLADFNYTLIRSSSTVSPICAVPFPPYSFKRTFQAENDYKSSAFTIEAIPCILEGKTIRITAQQAPVVPNSNSANTTHVRHWVTLIFALVSILAITG